MSPSLLLTATPTPTSDAPRLFGPTDCTKTRTTVFCSGGRPSLTLVTSTHVDTRPDADADADDSSSSDSASERDDASRRRMPACPWTGTPIRAIVPLPRRALCVSNAPSSTVSTTTDPADTTTDTTMTSARTPCRVRHLTDVWDDLDTDSTDSGGSGREERYQGDDTNDDEDEDGEETGDGEDKGCDEERDVCTSALRSRYCSYESITAAQGLAAWSFEELRVECYAQSLVARGTKPSPVIQPSLAIPPAFVPRVVRLPRS